MTSPDPVPALSPHAEAEFARTRAYWAALRDGGALSPEDEAEAEAIRREVEQLGRAGD